MKARIYVQLNIFFRGVTVLFLPGLIIPALLWIVSDDDATRSVSIVLFVLMSILFLPLCISSAMRSKKYCDYLEQRGLMEDAASQLKAQSWWGEDYILTKDYYFNRRLGEVICLEDLVRIGLLRKIKWDSEDQENYIDLELRLTTRQGDVLKPHMKYDPRKDNVLQQQFEILQARYPEKVSNAEDDASKIVFMCESCFQVAYADPDQKGEILCKCPQCGVPMAEIPGQNSVRDPSLLDEHAAITDMRSEKVMQGKNGAKFRTTVTFSDGFQHVSHRTNYEPGTFPQKASGNFDKISMNSLLKREIIYDAIFAHDVTVEKEKKITIPEHSIEDIERIMGSIAASARNADLLPPSWTCIHCGTRNKVGKAVCSKCGKS